MVLHYSLSNKIGQSKKIPKNMKNYYNHHKFMCYCQETDKKTDGWTDTHV